MKSLKILFMGRRSWNVMTGGDRYGHPHDSTREIRPLDHLTLPADKFKATFHGHGFRERIGDAAGRAGARAGAIARSRRDAPINWSVSATWNYSIKPIRSCRARPKQISGSIFIGRILDLGVQLVGLRSCITSPSHSA